MEYPEEAVITFSRGLFAFEDEQRFVLIENPATRPIVFLQSLARPELCFLALPARVVDPEYQLEIAPEDLETIGLPADETPRIGEDLLCLTLIAVREGSPTTANLLAPVVICMRGRKGVQAISTAAVSYSHETAFLEVPGGVACS
jgi:flagellar assembly factor FliW